MSLGTELNHTGTFPDEMYVSSNVVTPEGTDRPNPKRPTSRLVVVVIAGFAAVVGLIGFGALTQPDPEAAPESTTSTTTVDLRPPLDLDNFDVGQIAMGAQLDWHRNEVIHDVVGSNLVVHDGNVLLISSPSIPNGQFRGDGPGEVLRMTNAGWQRIGDLPPGVPAHVVTSTDQGLLGVSIGRNGQSPLLWTSLDGTSWSSEELPTIVDSERVTTWGASLNATHFTTLVSLQSDLDIVDAVSAHYQEVYGSELDVNYFWPGVYNNGEESVVTVQGPFGMAVWEFPASDIGLTDVDIELLNRGFSSELFSRTEGEWSQAEIDAEWINSLETTADGAIFAFGWPGTQGRTNWLTYDGVNWERLSSTHTPYEAVSFDSGLAGIWDGGHSSLVISRDGVEWERALEGEFPFQFGWWVRALRGGPGGIAAVFEGFESSGPAARAPTPTIVVGDVTLTLNYPMGQIDLVSDTGTVSYQMWAEPNTELIEFDVAEWTISFRHPETGDLLLTMPIDDFAEVESGGFWTNSDIRYTALAHSADGVEWSIDDVASHIGDDAVIEDIAVTHSQIVISVRRTENAIPLIGGAGSDIEIWTAPLP